MQLVYNKQVGPAKDKTIVPTFFQLSLDGGCPTVNCIKWSIMQRLKEVVVPLYPALQTFSGLLLSGSEHPVLIQFWENDQWPLEGKVMMKGLQCTDQWDILTRRINGKTHDSGLQILVCKDPETSIITNGSYFRKVDFFFNLVGDEYT